MTTCSMGDIGYKLQFPVEYYHHQVKNSLCSATTDVSLSKKVMLLLSSPILYPTLGTIAAIGTIFVGIDYILENPDKLLKRNIDLLRNEGSVGWQEKAIKLIRSGRYQSSYMELKRLRNVGIFTPEREKKVDEALKHVATHHFSFSKQLKSKILIGQAYEIREIYEKSHDTFIHAQATKWMIFAHLIKELVRTFHPEVDIKQFKFLRAPCGAVDLSLLDSVWNFAKSFFGGSDKPKNVKDYINSKWWINDDNNKVREDLLSVDALFYNYSTCESSLYFLINNNNILNNQETIRNFTKKVIQYFCPSLTNQTLINTYCQKIIKAAEVSAECGNLFVISLPKKESHQIHYRAHPFGAVCKCHNESQKEELLKKLQNDILDENTHCNALFLPKVPQFRLYTPLFETGW